MRLYFFPCVLLVLFPHYISLIMVWGGVGYGVSGWAFLGLGFFFDWV